MILRPQGKRRCFVMNAPSTCDARLLERLLLREGHVLQQRGRDILPGVAFRGIQVSQSGAARSPEEDGAEDEVAQTIPLPEGISHRVRNLFLLNLDLRSELGKWLTVPTDNTRMMSKRDPTFKPLSLAQHFEAPDDFHWLFRLGLRLFCGRWISGRCCGSVHSPNARSASLRRAHRHRADAGPQQPADHTERSPRCHPFAAERRTSLQASARQVGAPRFSSHIGCTTMAIAPDCLHRKLDPPDTGRQPRSRLAH